VLAAVAGARRTASAYPRMLAATSAPELLVSPPGEAGADPTPFYEAIGDLPGVRSLGVIALRLEVVRVGTFANEVIPFNDLDEFGTVLVPPR
jgi:hypothetical protein